jgi:hypothetical protein
VPVGALDAAPEPIAPEEVGGGLFMVAPWERLFLFTPGVVAPELMALGADIPGLVAPGVEVEAPGVIVPMPVPLFMPLVPFMPPEVAPPVGFIALEPIEPVPIEPAPVAPGLAAPPAPAPAPPPAGAWAKAVEAAAMAAATLNEIKTLRMGEVPFLGDRYCPKACRSIQSE